MKPTTRTTTIVCVVAGLAVLGGFGLAHAASNLPDDGATTTLAVVAQTDATTDTIVEIDPDSTTDNTVEHGRPEWHERTEELLTGDIADQVTAAALVAVPGGTVERVETDDDDGSVYEAHMTDVDGSWVTVIFDEDLDVVEIREGGRYGRDGHGRDGHGRGGHSGRDGCDDEIDATTDTGVES